MQRQDLSLVLYRGKISLLFYTEARFKSCFIVVAFTVASFVTARDEERLGGAGRSEARREARRGGARRGEARRGEARCDEVWGGAKHAKAGLSVHCNVQESVRATKER